jgi:hypothetical protein
LILRLPQWTSPSRLEAETEFHWCSDEQAHQPAGSDTRSFRVSVRED